MFKLAQTRVLKIPKQVTWVACWGTGLERSIKIDAMTNYLHHFCPPCHCLQLQRFNHRYIIRAGNTGGAGGSMAPSLFCIAKRKKGNKGKKRKGFKAETIKKLSPKSKYYCFNRSRASRIRKFFLLDNHGGQQYFSVFHGFPTLKFISSELIILSMVVK